MRIPDFGCSKPHDAKMVCVASLATFLNASYSTRAKIKQLDHFYLNSRVIEYLRYQLNKDNIAKGHDGHYVSKQKLQNCS